jgi:hypothetical protein
VKLRVRRVTAGRGDTEQCSEAGCADDDAAITYCTTVFVPPKVKSTLMKSPNHAACSPCPGCIDQVSFQDKRSTVSGGLPPTIATCFTGNRFRLPAGPTTAWASRVG